MIGPEDARRWFEECQRKGKRYMNVICDTFDYDDYPSFTDTPMPLGDIGNMQRVMDVYDTTQPFEAQAQENYAQRIGI